MQETPPRMKLKYSKNKKEHHHHFWWTYSLWAALSNGATCIAPWPIPHDDLWLWKLSSEHNFPFLEGHMVADMHKKYKFSAYFYRESTLASWVVKTFFNTTSIWPHQGCKVWSPDMHKFFFTIFRWVIISQFSTLIILFFSISSKQPWLNILKISQNYLQH